MEIHTPATSQLKCPTCVADFSNQEHHKLHYKSDFHRYNLKRKMVKLPPVTQQQFNSKKTQTKLQQESELKCNECGKKFASLKTFDQHVRSKGHNPHSKPPTEPKINSKPIPVKFSKNNKVCLFCTKKCDTFSQNLRHMQSNHSFFIPQPSFCTSQQKLVEYLQEKIEVGFMCITCENKNAKDFSSGEAVRKHMNDKGHTFMKVDQGYDEYLEFYDFSRQFNQIVEEQKDRHIPGIEYTTLKVVVKDDKDEDAKNQQDEDWQDDSSQQNLIKDKEGQDQWQSDQQQQEEVVIKQKQEQIKQKQGKEKKQKNKVKTFHIMRPTHTANGQLLLPNGKILGHRKYRYLYRQTYRNPIWYTNTKALVNGFACSSNNSLILRDKLTQLMKTDKLLWKTKNRLNKKQLRNGVQNNMQKYFRTRNSL